MTDWAVTGVQLVIMALWLRREPWDTRVPSTWRVPAVTASNEEPDVAMAAAQEFAELLLVDVLEASWRTATPLCVAGTCWAQ
jgi:hypothetical protein